jgi:hypothetical protein
MWLSLRSKICYTCIDEKYQYTTCTCTEFENNDLTGLLLKGPGAIDPHSSLKIKLD